MYLDNNACDDLLLKRLKWIVCLVAFVVINSVLFSMASMAHESSMCSLTGSKNHQVSTEHLSVSQMDWRAPINQVKLRPIDRLLEDVSGGVKVRTYLTESLSLPLYLEDVMLWRLLTARAPLRREGLMVIGDSLSATSHYLSCVVSDRVSGLKDDWISAIESWKQRGDFSVIERDSFAAQHGATTWDLLTPREFEAKAGYGSKRLRLFKQEEDPLISPLEREMNHNLARYASVLIGSNDLHYRNGFERFAWRLIQLVESLLDAGIYPILQTLPPQNDKQHDKTVELKLFNKAIKAIATVKRLPLLDLHLSLRGLKQFGLRRDGIHLNAYAGGCRFNNRGLRYGQNLRNSLFLDAYAVIKARREGYLGARSSQPEKTQNSKLAQVIFSRLEGKSATFTSELDLPCQKQMLKRSMSVKAWRRELAVSTLSDEQAGPPLHAYGLWLIDRVSFEIDQSAEQTMISLLNPGIKRDASVAQLWIKSSDGRCIELSRSSKVIELQRGSYELLHYYRSVDDEGQSIALFSW